MDTRRGNERVTTGVKRPPPDTALRRLTLAVVALAVALAASLTVGTVAYVQGRADTEALIASIGGRTALRDLENNTLRQQIDAAVCDSLLPWPADDPTAAAVRAERGCPDPVNATPAPPAASSDSAPQAEADGAAPGQVGPSEAPALPSTGPDPPQQQSAAATQAPAQPPTASTPAAQPSPVPTTPAPTPAPTTAPPPPDRGLLCQLLPLDLVCDL